MKKYIYALLGILLFASLSIGADLPKERCLTCHDWAEMSKKEPYYLKADKPLNPHRYVPHESTDIMECVSCHTPHDEENPDAAKVIKADVTACYTCHHSQTFKMCNECHTE